MLRWLLVRGLAPVAVGLALGLAAALGTTRVLSALLYGIGPFDIDRSYDNIGWDGLYDLTASASNPGGHRRASSSSNRVCSWVVG